MTDCFGCCQSVELDVLITIWVLLNLIIHQFCQFYHLYFYFLVQQTDKLKNIQSDSLALKAEQGFILFYQLFAAATLIVIHM